MKIKVKQFEDKKNQFQIETDDGFYFQSYNSIICFCPKKGKTQLDKNYYDYSKTTSRYRNAFLGCNSKELQHKIDSGEYELVNLN